MQYRDRKIVDKYLLSDTLTQIAELALSLLRNTQDHLGPYDPVPTIQLCMKFAVHCVFSW